MRYYLNVIAIRGTGFSPGVACEETNGGQKKPPVMAAMKKALGGWGSICQAAMQGHAPGLKVL